YPGSLPIAASSTELASWRYPGSLRKFTWDAVACHGTTSWSCHGSLPIAASSTELASWRGVNRHHQCVGDTLMMRSLGEAPIVGTPLAGRSCLVPVKACLGARCEAKQQVKPCVQCRRHLTR
ncbi:MAG: hypothetical protein ACI31F_05215, partial [Muribaculaceae bacterium]